MRVLIVEDNPVDLKLMRAVLASDGITVGERSSALGALEALQEERPDVILLDLQLPDDDGVNLVRELKRSPHTCDIPIVAVTAFPSRYRVRVMRAGCAACLVKPIDTRQLAATLGEVARTARSGRQP